MIPSPWGSLAKWTKSVLVKNPTRPELASRAFGSSRRRTEDPTSGDWIHGKIDSNWAVLGIETSFDDTSAAVVTSEGKLLSEANAKDWAPHAPFRGVVPHLAAAYHREHITRVISCALDDANVTPNDLAGIAVTVGPGLTLSLRAGIDAAATLASATGLPLIPINHMEAHVLSPQLMTTEEPPIFPFLVMLVSGGHTQLALAHGPGAYHLLGSTLDDALGEALDKAARMLGLGADSSTPLAVGPSPSPMNSLATTEHHGSSLSVSSSSSSSSSSSLVGLTGGPALEAMARGGNPNALRLPTPLTKQGTRAANVSFAGLKTALLHSIVPPSSRGDPRALKAAAVGPGPNATPYLPPGVSIADAAASFQRATFSHVLRQLKTVNKWTNAHLPRGAVRDLVVAGGVAANGTFRSMVTNTAKTLGLRAVFPPLELCTDNGAMIAWAGVGALRAGLIENPDRYMSSPGAALSNWNAMKHGAAPPQVPTVRAQPRLSIDQDFSAAMGAAKAARQTGPLLPGALPEFWARHYASLGPRASRSSVQDAAPSISPPQVRAARSGLEGVVLAPHLVN